MSNEMEIEYNLSLRPLEELLSSVSKPGEFFMQGSKELPMPTITINGVGTLSFPILEAQVKAMIQEACLAPYGKGEETILDTSVRKTWQMPPTHVQIGGKSWQKHFDAILSEVKEALGCHEVKVSAELYKLLIYDEGAFFLPHRDSEKSPGMFGTMVIALPSSHEGGQLIVLHKDQKATIDLSGAEGSELKYGAFYADCEHEVLPVTKGYRVCLIYNLIQTFSGKNQPDHSNVLKAPCCVDEVQEAAEILQAAFSGDNAPSKLVWLLDHQYSKAELSFTSLKNIDAAIAKVLLKAADVAKCAIHLGMVHIQESGPAEADFGYYSSRSRRRGSYNDEEMDVDSGDYEVVDIDSQEQYVDDWVDHENQEVDFGRLPIKGNELLPSHSLDGVEPDEQRLLEATGNAGVSFERAYHRAALILWPHESYIKILLQSGIKNGVSYFKEQMNLEQKDNQFQWQEAMKKMALSIISKYEQVAEPQYPSMRENSTSAEMLTLLCKLKEPSLIERFIHVINASYDGSENDALLAAVDILEEPSKIDHLFSDLFQKNMFYQPVACMHLYKKLASISCQKSASANPTPLKDALKNSSQVIVNELKSLNQRQADLNARHFWREQKRTKINAEAIVLLWSALEELGEKKLQEAVVSTCIEKQDIFGPQMILAPALVALQSFITPGSPLLSLWEHASNCLLTRSEYPPKPPTTWTQDVKISCSCNDCKDLKAFLNDPKLQIHRFQMPEDRRDHVEHQLRSSDSEMSTTTDKSRRPYTLVCQKTRRKYEEKCKAYQEDIKTMGLLMQIFSNLDTNRNDTEHDKNHERHEHHELTNIHNKLMEAVKRYI